MCTAELILGIIGTVSGVSVLLFEIYKFIKTRIRGGKIIAPLAKISLLDSPNIKNKSVQNRKIGSIDIDMTFLNIGDILIQSKLESIKFGFGYEKKEPEVGFYGSSTIPEKLSLLPNEEQTIHFSIPKDKDSISELRFVMLEFHFIHVTHKGKHKEVKILFLSILDTPDRIFPAIITTKKLKSRMKLKGQRNLDKLFEENIGLKGLYEFFTQ